MERAPSEMNRPLYTSGAPVPIPVNSAVRFISHSEIKASEPCTAFIPPAVILDLTNSICFLKKETTDVGMCNLKNT